jgi:M6 family metalloprotease-like protein
MVNFRAVNARMDPVDLFSLNGTQETPEGEAQPGVPGQHSAPEGQVWVARTRTGEIVGVYEATRRVPDWTIATAATGFAVNLKVPSAGDYNESLVPNGRFLEASGDRKAVMLFVDFTDVQAAGAAWADERQIEARLVGGAGARLQQVSFGALRLTVDAVHGWKQMPRQAAEYSQSQLSSFIEDAVGLFSGVPFSRYDIVYIVAAKTGDFPLSPVWVAPQGSPISTATGEVRYAVAFGEDSYAPKNQTFLLLHETYHLLGLPDLYDGGQVSGTGGFSDGGLSSWDLMADQEADSDLLAWHRLKLRWLHPSQLSCVYGAGTIEIDLADWTSPDGVKAIMIPITHGEDPEHARRAYIVEVANPQGGGPIPGVLIYTVDGGLATWDRPIQMRGGSDALSAQPIPEGDWFRHLNGNVRIDVSQRLPNGFRIRVVKG